MKQYIALIWLFSSILIGQISCQSRSSRKTEQNIPIGVKRTISSFVPDYGKMSMTYQKKRINGLLSFEGQITLNSLEYFSEDDYEIRVALEWGLENQFYKDRSQRLAFYGKVGDGRFDTWKIVNPFNGTYRALDDYRWFCSLSQDDPYNIDQEGILTLIEIKDSVINKETREIKLTFTMPIKRGYFNMPEQGVYRMAFSWGIFPSRDSSDMGRVRGMAAPARTWSLEYMALPESFMREDESVTYRAKTYVFIIGKAQPFGPLFPDPYFMEELEFSILVMYLFSCISYLGIPPFIAIAFFLTIYNVWSIAYAGHQLLTVDNTDPLQRKFFTVQNFIFGPVRQLFVNLSLYYFAIGANTFPFINVFLNAIFVGLIYINMIVIGPDGIDLDDSN